MPYNLLLLPLLGGFVFLHRVYALRFRAQRLDGNRLLFESAIYGAILLFGARLVVVVSENTWFPPALGDLWWKYAPFPHSDSTAVALVLAFVVPYIVNWRMPVNDANTWAIRRSGDGLMVLLNTAYREQSLVSVTLANMKWYVGYVVELPNLKPQDTYLTLLPVISGYRDRNDLTVKPVVHYSRALQANPEANLSVVVPISDIKTATVFDPDIYNDFFAPSGISSAVSSPAGNNPSGRST